MTARGRPGLVALASAVLVGAAVLLLPAPWGVAPAVALAGGALWWAARARPHSPQGHAAPTLPDDPGIAPVLDRLVEGVLLLDAGQVVRFVNTAAASHFERPREEMLDTSLIRATRDAGLARLAREADGEPYEITLDGGRVLRVTALHQTAQRRAERARQDLVANISHELRTPITAARALAETLEDGVPDEAVRARFHRQLAGEIDRMQGIVERLIRLSRIEQGDEPFEFAPALVSELIHEAIHRMAPPAERAGVVLTADVALAASTLVVADRERILEVLTNLLDNSIKFSTPGDRIVAGAVPDENVVRFCVSDEGPGIMPNERHRVFERFYTSDRSRTGGQPTGTGLGLSIARQIVSRHGGVIWVADESRGTTICFTVPVVDVHASET